jgi:hypothetical protein
MAKKFLNHVYLSSGPPVLTMPLECSKILRRRTEAGSRRIAVNHFSPASKDESYRDERSRSFLYVRSPNERCFGSNCWLSSETALYLISTMLFWKHVSWSQNTINQKITFMILGITAYNWNIINWIPLKLVALFPIEKNSLDLSSNELILKPKAVEAITSFVYLVTTSFISSSITSSVELMH